MTGFKKAETQGLDQQADNAPSNDNRDKTRLQKFFSRNTLSTAFNMAATAGTGAVVGFAVKTTALTFFGSQFLAIAAGAAAISASTTAVKRALDIRAHNKAHADNKVSYVKDFFKAEKTGHTAAHYKKTAAVSAGLALLGGAGGYFLADWLNGAAPDAAPDAVPGGETGHTVTPPGEVVPETPDTTPEQAPVDNTPVEDTPEEQAPVDEAPVEDTPVEDTPVEDAPVEETPGEDTPVEDTPVDTAPDAAPEADTDTTPDTTTDSIATPAPLADRVAHTLDQARALLPEAPGRQLAETLNRLESASERVQAQALKDLGYFFANGKAGLLENDFMANQLYELSIEVSGGQNTQALHDLGYHLLHGHGTAVNTDRAYELLSAAAEGGNKLSQPMLNYMAQHGMTPN